MDIKKCDSWKIKLVFEVKVEKKVVENWNYARAFISPQKIL